jgi:DNA-binding LytR/AlgR family response regulator
MKYTTHIDPNREEEVIIRVQRRTRAVDDLEAYIESLDAELTGYGGDGRIVPLSPAEVHCFVAEKGRVYALTDNERLAVRLPLYAIEEMLDQSFVRINQSCIGNIRRIDRFASSIGGSLMVIFQNAHRDYVSRRQLKAVKERMNFKR